jgi:hypothetical protein
MELGKWLTAIGALVDAVVVFGVHPAANMAAAKIYWLIHFGPFKSVTLVRRSRREIPTLFICLVTYVALQIGYASSLTKV